VIFASKVAKYLLPSVVICGIVCLIWGLCAFPPLDNAIGNKIVLRLSSDPKSFNPILAQESSTTSVTSLMFVGLVKIDPFTQEPVPELAQSWQVSDDGKRWIFTLRDGLKWSDGESLTAYDVEFTFNSLIYNPDIPNSAKDIFQVHGRKIQVRAIDDRRVEFVLPDVFAPFLRSLTQEILPRHILEKWVRDKKFNFVWSLGTKPKEIVVNGPFRLKRFLPGQVVELERNPYYYRKGLPMLDGVIMLIISSDDSAFLKFLEGELDVISLRALDYSLLKRLSPEGIKIYKLGPALGSNFLAFNLNPNSSLPRYKLNWFREEKFRQAIGHCIDREGIIKTVYRGLAEPQYGPMNSSNGFFYNPNLCEYDYDLNHARTLLSELGFQDKDGDGILEDRFGHRLELNLITNANSSERVQIASMIASDLARCGIKCNFVAVDFNNLVIRLTNSFDWELILIGLTGGMDPHFGRNVWHSSGSLHIWWPKEPHPFFDWEKEIDEIFERGVRVLNEGKRKALYDKWQKIISCKVPVIYTITPFRLFAVRDRIIGIKPSPYLGLLYNIDEISIKKDNHNSIIHNN